MGYDPTTATLTLEHDVHPVTSKAGSPMKTIARVDAHLVLDCLYWDKVRVGEWLNVLGYVEKHKIEGGKFGQEYLPVKEQPQYQPALFVVNIQATYIWSTGPMDIDRYVQTVRVLEAELSG
jgi:hypothetical protein